MLLRVGFELWKDFAILRYLSLPWASRSRPRLSAPIPALCCHIPHHDGHELELSEGVSPQFFFFSVHGLGHGALSQKWESN